MTAAVAPRLKVLISGATGLIGRALVESLSVPSAVNHFNPQVYTLVRHEPHNERQIYWNPYEQRIDIKKLEDFDAIVHLAGENVGSGDGLLAFTGRWNDRKKHHIMESRRRGTTLLATAAASVKNKPRVFISASGTGYYGSAGDEVLTEASPRGTGFLAEVSRVWEDSCEAARAAGIRTVNLRMSPVLSRDGGMLEKLYWPFYFCAGGPVGSGRQYMSWITLEDAVRAIEFAIGRPDLTGPVNVCSPNPLRNAEFMSALGAAMRRPAILPMPEPVVRAVFGEMGEETLLVSQRAVPEKLTAAGFRFMHPDIHGALAAALHHHA